METMPHYYYIRIKNRNSLPLSHTIGESFIELKSADSTNNYAMDAARSGVGVHGTAWFTDNQTAGRGQRGKQWKDVAGQNLAISILLDTSQLALENQFALIMLGALATFDLLSSVCKNSLKIKWANDLYIDDKKAVGILTESIIKGTKWQWTVIGIGINVNQEMFDSSISNKATSLRMETGQQWNLKQLGIDLCQTMESRWMQLQQGGITSLLDDYNAHLYLRGQQATFKNRSTEEIITVEIQQVNSDGKLLVLHQGNLIELPFGSVELLSH